MGSFIVTILPQDFCTVFSLLYFSLFQLIVLVFTVFFTTKIKWQLKHLMLKKNLNSYWLSSRPMYSPHFLSKKPKNILKKTKLTIHFQ